MKKSAFILALLAQSLYVSWCSLAFSQFNRTKNWVLGDKILLDFNVNPANSGLSSLFSDEGMSVISDLNGNLLFYTNGIFVWNAQHQIMPNGQGLLANSSTTDAALIIPLPENNHTYYIFTPSAGNFDFPGVIAYSIVDMSLNGGLGDVTQKNVIIHPDPYPPLPGTIPLLSTEKLCATKHANGIDYWIMTHDYGNNQFRAFLLTSNGIHPKPVISKIGAKYTDKMGLGCMRFSPSGCRLATVLCKGALDTVEIFDFDKTSGYVHNLIQLKAFNWGQWGELPEEYPDDLATYGICFSPDNTKLYVSAARAIVQFDLSSNNPTLIQQSRYPVASALETLFSFRALQIAPDGKIYIAKPSSSSLCVINHPNDLGGACNFVASGVVFPGYFCRLGLPNFVSNFLVPDSVVFPSCNQYCPVMDLQDTVVVCDVDTFGLEIDLPAGELVWDTQDTGFYLSVTQTSSYTLTYTYKDCPVQTDSISVIMVQNPLPGFGNMVVCIDTGFTINLPMEDNMFYLWSDGTEGSIFTTQKAGVFTVEAQQYHCVFTEKFAVINFCKPDTLFVDKIPNVFTPNNDGENDVFTIYQTGVKELQFMIYNRWGSTVHQVQLEPTQKKVEIWDGGNASEGTYFYTATFISADGQLQERKGLIQVFK